jgi:hypothetical protein
MAKQKDNKKKTSTGTSRAYNRKGNAADVQKSITANTKKVNAMSPAQKKAYIAKQAKAIGKTTAQVASMVGGPGLARKAAAAAARKVIASGVTKKTAVDARARGKQYQSEVNRFVNWEKTSSRIPGWDKDMARKSDKAFEAMKLRSKIEKARNK